MVLNKKRTLIAIAIASCMAWNTASATINEPQGVSVQILSSLQNSSQVAYINASYWINGEVEPPSMTTIRDNVLKLERRYLIDFTAIEDPSQKEEAKKLLSNKTGLSFTSDFLVITPHKGELLYTPLVDENDPNKFELETPLISELRDGSESVNSDASTLPHVAFYLRVNRPITDQECTFDKSLNFENKGQRVFCDNANISLIYRVILERSLPYGKSGSATPDAKIVRISLDDDTSGVGIHLNEKLDHEFSHIDLEADNAAFIGAVASSIFSPLIGASSVGALSASGTDYNSYDGYVTDWATDAIAQDYEFAFSASNDKASILRTVPSRNLNKDYNSTEVSTFQIGGSLEAGAGPDGPKATLGANASYSQQLRFSFDTQDYRVERIGTDAQNIRFKWAREQYDTAESMMNRSTDALWANVYPLDISRISPISYTGFVPKMEVIYTADPSVTGKTEFTIDSSVNIRPIYNGTYKHFVTNHSYHGFENDGRRRVNESVSFEVDWNHPVFTGGRPVNLQLGGFNNRCIGVSKDGTIVPETCDSTKDTQSFIFDKSGRYMSANNVSMCLDGESLDKLQTCSQNLSQRWSWKDNSNHLVNGLNNQNLGHDKSTGQLGLYSQETDSAEVSLRTITTYADVFTADAQ
ncbi:hemolysin [Vibrio sp. OCN044]|uniref:Hemolysin n=1 Tax=Vibrio tetraodonis subsp. pristinus TaxID=2695891 RepID=A0A6L8LTV5_9VIBR|nr:leukocidin family pore-forming toxin [Vibrio tetraodonis]MYM59155.1 hemolysin [Vibrio tetraodonis subsp. pristinus]